MTLAHFLYIPAMLGLGALIGYIVRGRVESIRAEAPPRRKDDRDAANEARRRAGAGHD
jgi:hypothetical protein